ncbi:MAG: aspartate-semialdehyde dehydrogenase [Desulfobacteraceae bacterium]|nr:aspartate-semialdehyde dehydrogenase [Desulfobacteraceae bacterium]
MRKVGFIGWRGMVGSVLLQRMVSEGNFSGIAPVFFSTSQIGQNGPDVGSGSRPLEDGLHIESLSEMEIIVSCQGGGYTSRVYPQLRETGWKGYWIDAASTLRMAENSIIALDPVNREVIDEGLSNGVTDFIGGNCTVSLMLMALGGLFRQGLIEWMTSMTYQAASGAGAKNMRELVTQMGVIGADAQALMDDPAASILDIDRKVNDTLSAAEYPTELFGAPLAGSLIPWIDRPMDNGQTREEWKGFAETNKILGQHDNPVPVDGLCVRIGTMRCHSQAFTIKLTRNIPINEIESILTDHNQWVKVIPNTREDSLKALSTAAVSGTLSVPVGRIRKLNMGEDYLAAFSIGDQLLWGAAEPLRRVLRIILEHLG